MEKFTGHGILYIDILISEHLNMPFRQRFCSGFSSVIKKKEDLEDKLMRKATLAFAVAAAMAMTSMTAFAANSPDSNDIIIENDSSDDSDYSGSGTYTPSNYNVSVGGTNMVAAVGNDGEVVTGIWNNFGSGQWSLTLPNGQLATGWYDATNPYANTGVGQDAHDWFLFNEDGKMMTGWQWVNGRLYYLNERSDGTLGRCVTNTVVDGRQLDANGAWVVNGVVQVH